ncbi:uncharacterized protein LOC130674944 [Microplitis mediator]|uniref:uncharacterized protein LOC130674944 n=1 Tax=Microplitis mediator TaxID=375433 RepID=UPI002556F7AA|nr:uncharacterized protein LOC130674944 [Microplitis mediator]
MADYGNAITSSQESDDIEMVDSSIVQTPIGVVQDINARKIDLSDECRKRPYLDGKFFVPDLNQSTLNGTIVGICQICRTENNKTHSIKGSFHVPSNYSSHIKKVHRDKYDGYKKYVSAKRQKNSEEKKDLKTYCNFSQARFEENVVNYILETLIPFNTVECEAFRKIFDDMTIKKGRKELSHLSARTVKRRVKDTFNQNMELLKFMMNSAEYVCTTADVWTSKSRRFLGMTAHWIEKNTLERKSYAIACCRFPGTHSYDQVARKIGDIHSFFGLDKEKVIATVTDNGSNFGKAFRQFGVSFDDLSACEESRNTQESDSDDDNSTDENDYGEVEPFMSPNERQHEEILPHHILCASHTLNLVATTDALACIKSSKPLESAYTRMIERCNCLWKLTSSPKKYEQMKSILNQSLRRPVPTRWNSLYNSILQIFGLKQKLLVCNKELGVINPLDELDFRFMEEWLHCNQPIARAIDILQGDQLACYGYLLPSLISIKNKLIDCKELKMQFCLKLAVGLVKAIDVRFKKIFQVEEEGKMAAAAAASHPLFKLDWLESLSGAAQTNVFKAMKEAVNSVDSSPPPEVKTMVKNNDFFDFRNRSGSQEQRVLEPFGTTDPEVLFTKHTSESRTDLELLNLYPVVKDIFIKYNTIIPSSAPVERLFSYATMFNLPKYNRLSDDNFEMRILMRCNASISKKIHPKNSCTRKYSSRYRKNYPVETAAINFSIEGFLITISYFPFNLHGKICFLKLGISSLISE